MNEEKAVETLNKIQDRAMLTQLEVDLSNLCIKRRNIIRKAIEYIEEYQEVLKEHNGDWLNYQDGFKPYLLDILRGEDIKKDLEGSENNV